MANEKKVRFNINNWTYEDFVNFTNAIRVGDNDVLFDLAAQIIVGWDYDIDLSSPEPLMALGVIESGRVIGSIFDTINKASEDVSTEGVIVDFSKWNTRRFLEFDKLRRESKTRKAEEMMFEIVKIDGWNSKEDRLSFIDGSRAIKAVNEEYKKLVTGKG